MTALPWWLFAWVLAVSVVVMIFGGLRVAQLFGVGLLLALSVSLWWRNKRQRKKAA